MIRTHMIGDARITSLLEYSGPTHPVGMLFPTLNRADLEAQKSWMAPMHWVPHMDRLIISIYWRVIHIGNEIIVMDAGVGNDKDRANARMHHLNTLVLPWLEAAGAPPEKVTHVVLTHLHGDHVGWCTRKEGDRWVPTFPNARHHWPRIDFEYFKARFEKDPKSASGFDDALMPVIEAGLVDMFEPEGELPGGLLIEPAPGHTPGQVVFTLKSKGETGIFCADIAHSPLQIVLPELNSAFCSDPAIAQTTRKRVLAKAADTGALIMPCHFGGPGCGYVRRWGNGYMYESAAQGL